MVVSYRSLCRPRVGLALVALLLPLTGCEREEGPLRVHSERIGNVGFGYRSGSLHVSRDLRHMTWVDRIQEDCRVVRDREKGPLFAHCANPVFSPNGETLAYFAAHASENDMRPPVRLYANGEPAPAVVGRDGPIAFARRGGAWGAVAQAYVAGPIGEPTPSATPEPTPTATSASGTTKRAKKPNLASPSPAASPSPTAEEKAAAVPPVLAFATSKVFGEYASVSNPAVSSDGAHVAYIAADAAGQHTLYVDGQVRRSFAAPSVKVLPILKSNSEGPGLDPEASVAWLSDGSLVSVALDDQGWAVWHDDQLWASYPQVRLPPRFGFESINMDFLSAPAILAGSLVAADDAPTACWWERLRGDADRWRVMRNGNPTDAQVCDMVWGDLPITVARDGKSCAYVCQIEPTAPPGGTPNDPRNFWVVVDGKKYGPHRFVWGIDVSADARHFVYGAADEIEGSWYFVVDGQRIGGTWEQIFPPRMSADGTWFVWGARRTEKDPRVDLVVNGNTISRVETVMAPPVFGERSVSWGVKRGRSVRRIVASR